MFTAIGILLIVVGAMFIMEGKAQKKEKKQQERFNNGCYGLFKQHHWLKDDDD